MDDITNLEAPGYKLNDREIAIRTARRIIAHEGNQFTDTADAVRVAKELLRTLGVRA